MFEDILQNPSLLAWVKDFEKSYDPDLGSRISSIVGTPDGIKWYRTRRLVSFFIWDIHTANAIAHYRRDHPNTQAPLLKDIGVVTGNLPLDLAEKLEKAYYGCEIVSWRDERPAGYSYYPFTDTGYFASYDRATVHRVMTAETGNLLTEAMTHLAPEIEKTLGHYWTPGAVRVFAGRAKVTGGYHSDLWPLGLKKIMIYPSGAGIELGSTEIILKDGTKKLIEGGKGVWTIFENTLLQHQAFGGQVDEARPSIEIPLIPSFKTDPTIRTHAIHVGYPWLPPDLESLTGENCPTSFASNEVMERTLLRMLVLGAILPDNLNLPPFLKGLGVFD